MSLKLSNSIFSTEVADIKGSFSSIEVAESSILSNLDSSSSDVNSEFSEVKESSKSSNLDSLASVVNASLSIREVLVSANKSLSTNCSVSKAEVSPSSHKSLCK